MSGHTFRGDALPIAAHRPGETFELQLHALFAAHGYRAEHDARRTGRSGAEHQVDVWAELDLPLQVVRVVVEAKNHGAPVDKDALLKLQQIVDDLGADRGVLASTSGFTPGALKMAAGRNVDLWDRERVTRLLGEVALGQAGPGLDGVAAATQGRTLALAPRLAHAEARARVEAEAGRRRRGGLFGVGRVDETVAGVELVQRPLYELELEVEVTAEERRGLLARETVRTLEPRWLLVDAVRGDVLVADAGPGAVVLRATGFLLPELTAEEADAVAVLRGAPFTRADLVARGVRPARALQLVAALAAKGLAVEARLEGDGADGAPGAWQIAAAPGVVPAREPSSSLLALIEDAGGELVEHATLSRAGAVHAAEALLPGAQVRSLTVLLYPLWAVTLARPGGARREELLDGLSGATIAPGDPLG